MRAGATELSFAELVQLAWLDRVSLWATGFYKTPKIHYDRASFSGRPFFYYAYGAAVSEVIVDTLTGEYRVTRVDILHDCGDSLNPAIDLGQVEGGFIQGMGWLTAEELCWNAAGELNTHAPSTYKIPTCSDLPVDFRVQLLQNAANREDTIYRSKAVGEPPLMLALSVFHAIRDAIASPARPLPDLQAPATPEAVLRAARRAAGMNEWIDELADATAAGERVVVVTVAGIRGSAPREVGAKMIVTATETLGTIGGGQLEYQCTRLAFDMLQGDEQASMRKFPLGTAMGQCCGGVVDILFEPLASGLPAWLQDLRALHGQRVPAVMATRIGHAAQKCVITATNIFGASAAEIGIEVIGRARYGLDTGRIVHRSDDWFLELVVGSDLNIAVFGAGHVGSAVVQALSALDCNIRWVDSRRNIFRHTPANVRAIECRGPGARGRGDARRQQLSRHDAQPRARLRHLRSHPQAQRCRVLRPDRFARETAALRKTLSRPGHAGGRACGAGVPDRRRRHQRQKAGGDRACRRGRGLAGARESAACRRKRVS